MDHQLAVLFSDMDVAVVLLDRYKFAFRGGFEGFEDGFHVHVVGGEASNLNFARSEPPMIDGRYDLLGQRNPELHANPVAGGWGADPYMHKPLPGSSPHDQYLQT